MTDTLSMSANEIAQAVLQRTPQDTFRLRTISVERAEEIARELRSLGCFVTVDRGEVELLVTRAMQF